MRGLLRRHGFTVEELERANMLPLNRTAALGPSATRAIWSLSSALARVPLLNVLATNIESVAVESGTGVHEGPIAPGVALVGDGAVREVIGSRLDAFDETDLVSPTAGAAFTAPFRQARIGLVGASSRSRARLSPGRLFRMPWGLVVDRPHAERLAANPTGLLARLARQATLVVATSDAVGAVAAFAPRSRVVELEDVDRLRSVPG